MEKKLHWYGITGADSTGVCPTGDDSTGAIHEVVKKQDMCKFCILTSSSSSRGVRYTKFQSIRYFIDIDILQNLLIDIDIDIDIF